MTTANDLFDQIRHQIEHEDNLTCQRVSFLVNSQSFLLTAYAITLNAPVQLRDATHEHSHQELIRLLPICALSTIGLIYLSILGGIISMARLRRLARRNALDTERLPVQGTWITRQLGLASPLLVAPLFLAIWLAILLD